MSNSYDEITPGLSRKGERERGKLLNVGHGNFIVRNRVLAIVANHSLPSKRLRQSALDQGLLVDATKGKKTKSLIVTDSKHVILSSLTPQTLQDRMEVRPKESTLSDIEMEEGEFVS